MRRITSQSQLILMQILTGNFYLNFTFVTLLKKAEVLRFLIFSYFSTLLKKSDMNSTLSKHNYLPINRFPDLPERQM